MACDHSTTFYNCEVCRGFCCITCGEAMYVRLPPGTFCLDLGGVRCRECDPNAERWRPDCTSTAGDGVRCSKKQGHGGLHSSGWHTSQSGLVVLDEWGDMDEVFQRPEQT